MSTTNKNKFLKIYKIIDFLMESSCQANDNQRLFSRILLCLSLKMQYTCHGDIMDTQLKGNCISILTVSV